MTAHFGEEMLGQLGPDTWLDATDLGDALLRIPSLVSTAPVVRHDLQIREFRPSPGDIDSIVYRVSGNRRTIGEFLSRSHTDGLLVLRGDDLVCDEYFGAMTPGRTHLLMSVSKALAGIVAGIVLHETATPSDTVVQSVLHELRDSAYGPATIQQLLDMAVNLVFRMDFTDPGSEVFAEDRAAGWRPMITGDPPHSRAFLATLQASEPTKTAFQYCSATTDALAWTLEALAGERYVDLLSDLWSKIGAAHDAVVTVDAAGFPYAAAGICAAMSDVARFGRLVLDGGTWLGTEVIPGGWIAETVEGQGKAPDPSDERDGSKVAAYPSMTYHNQWWRLGDDRGTLFVPGLLGQYLWLDPTSDVVIVKLSSVPLARDAEFELEHLAALQAIAMTVGSRA